MLLLSRKWCSNCQSSECDCVSDDEYFFEPEEPYYDTDIDYDKEPISEKELWEAENKQLDNDL